MMLSHNELNGIQMHANHDIMTEHFRNRMGYEGFFASDLGNIEAVWQNSAVASNYSDAVALSLWAGMDQVLHAPFDQLIGPISPSNQLVITHLCFFGARVLTHPETALIHPRCIRQSPMDW
jgi:beta-glucosidase-like glycosyl hydrolase